MDVRFTPLGRDEPIGVVALSGPIAVERLDVGLAELESWGRPVVVAPNLTTRSGYLAGSDDERLAGLDWVLDRGARTVVAARGGYGLTRLLGRLPWERMVSSGVRCVGFSDMTALTGPLVERGRAAQVHGPMVASGLDDPRSSARLRSLLEGELVGRTLFEFGVDEVVRDGRAEGPSKGGNLSLICSLLGTPWQPDFEGSVVFLEDVGEPAYRLDRMLTHLRSSGRLRGVKALISGSLRGCGPVAERTHAWRRMVLESAPPEAVVVVDQPFGHGARNLAFPIGAVVEVDTAAGVIRWSD